MKSRITELLGIKYPIFQGGMAWVADGDLAGAVSNAGGLGIIGGGNAPKEVVKALSLIHIYVQFQLHQHQVHASNKRGFLVL